MSNANRRGVTLKPEERHRFPSQPRELAIKGYVKHPQARFLSPYPGSVPLSPVLPPSSSRLPMSYQLDSIIQLTYDLTGFKYYLFATCTLLFYDYLLTLADEIKYVWYGMKSWTFWLFILNRYLPMTYQLWHLAVSYNPQSQHGLDICERTAWYPNLVFVLSTLLAQVMLTLRIYAVTSKNAPIAIGFVVITTSQFVFGLYSLTRIIREGAQPLPPIPLDPLHLCLFVPIRSLHITYTGVSLFYDFLAFSSIIFVSKHAITPGLDPKFPSLWEIIARDATRYFLLIFSSHFALEAALIFARESLQLLTVRGIIVYLPVMVSRMMLSLRKAADPREQSWSITEPTADDKDFQSIKFFRPRRRKNEAQDDIPLERRDDMIPERQEGTSLHAQEV